ASFSFSSAKSTYDLRAIGSLIERETQSLADTGANLFERERLSAEQRALRTVLFRIAADTDDCHVRSRLPNASYGLITFHHGHLQVGDDQIDGVRIGAENRYS